MNSLGFSVETDDAGALICKRVDSDTIIINISKTVENNMGINMVTCSLNETMAIKLATKLARTPLNDRISSSKYEIVLPGLYATTGENLCVVEYAGRYTISLARSPYDKYIFSEGDMLNVPKEYHVFAKDIETGEPYISEGVSL